MCQNIRINDVADAIQDENPEVDTTFIRTHVEHFADEVTDEELERLMQWEE